MNAPRAEVRGAHWLKPKLVAEIAYTEMTDEGTLRHPSYLGLREDKKAEAVVLETEEAVAEIAAPATSSVKISNRDRVIDPDSGITKGQLADHYAAVAPIMLPWVGSRPMSLVRCPQGRAKKCFFQKHGRQLRRHGQACRDHGEGRASAMMRSGTGRRAGTVTPF